MEKEIENTGNLTPQVFIDYFKNYLESLDSNHEIFNSESDLTDLNLQDYYSYTNVTKIEKITFESKNDYGYYNFKLNNNQNERYGLQIADHVIFIKKQGINAHLFQITLQDILQGANTASFHKIHYNLYFIKYTTDRDYLKQMQRNGLKLITNSRNELICEMTTINYQLIKDKNLNQNIRILYDFLFTGYLRYNIRIN